MKKFRRILLLALMLAAMLAVMAVGAKAYAPFEYLSDAPERVLIVEQYSEEELQTFPVKKLLAELRLRDGTPAPVEVEGQIAWTYASSDEAYHYAAIADGTINLLKQRGGYYTLDLLVGGCKQLDFENTERYSVRVLFQDYSVFQNAVLQYRTDDSTWTDVPNQQYFGPGRVWEIADAKVNYSSTLPQNAEFRLVVTPGQSFVEETKFYDGAYSTKEKAEASGKEIADAVQGGQIFLPLHRNERGVEQSAYQAETRFTVVYQRNGRDCCWNFHAAAQRAGEMKFTMLFGGIEKGIGSYGGSSDTGELRYMFKLPTADLPLNGIYKLCMTYQEQVYNEEGYWYPVEMPEMLAEAYVDGGSVNIKDQLCGDGYAADYSGEGHVFLIKSTDGREWKCRVQMEEFRDDYDPYGDISFDATSTLILNGTETQLNAAMVNYQLDSLYRTKFFEYPGRVQTYLLAAEETVDLSHVRLVFHTSGVSRVYAREPGGAAVPQISGVSMVDFSKGPVQYTVVNAEGNYVKNYWVTFVQKQTEPKLFVNGPGFDAPQDAQSVEKSERREIVLADENDYHDVFIANLGASELSGLSVSLDEEAQKTLKLDDFWTVGGENNDTLTAFTETNSRKAQSMAKIRLRLKAAPENLGTSEISGLMTVTSSAGTRYVYLTGTIAPTLVTETIPNGVKYVPYSVMLQTNNHADQNQVTYTLVDGKLPEGVTLDSATGEIYGVPAQTGTFRFRVQASFSDAQLKSSEREYTLVIEDNTDENVAAASEDTILDYVADMAEGGYRDQVFRIDRAFNQFVKFFLDGEELVNGEDYDAVEGSTKITIRAKTFRRAGRGKHTIAAEFRDADNVMHKDAQNYNSYVTEEEPVDPKPIPEPKPVQPVQKPADNAAAPTGTFDDVRKSDWFYDNVMWAYEQKYMVGVSSRLFAPKQNITQAMAVTVLARLADADLKSFEKAGETAQWYTTAARWADSISLIELEKFAPAEPLPRGELAIMLVKLFDEIRVEYVKPDADEKTMFSDAAQMTAAEEEAFQTLYYAGIFRGNGKNDMQPDASTTRAQFAALIQRVSEYIDRRSGEKA